MSNINSDIYRKSFYDVLEKNAVWIFSEGGRAARNLRKDIGAAKARAEIRAEARAVKRSGKAGQEAVRKRRYAKMRNAVLLGAGGTYLAGRAIDKAKNPQAHPVISQIIPRKTPSVTYGSPMYGDY